MKAYHWVIAIAFSTVMHFTAAALFVGEVPDVQIEGAGNGAVAMIGDAFADTLSSHDVAAEMTPVEPEAQAIEEIIPSASPAVAPMTTRSVAALPANRTESIAAVGLVAVEPKLIEQALEQPALATLEAHVPAQMVLPTPRPQKAVVAQKLKAKKAKPSRAKKTAKAKTNKGRSYKTGTKGAAAGEKGKSKFSGNAAISNYPGKVARKLRRAVRYPRNARRKALRIAKVAFVVAANGRVKGVRLASGTGVPAFDKAALSAVRRASPFPPIPSQSGRKSWSFVVPIQFAP